ncbi:tetratricopeptide repeat protein [Sphingobacterium thalpophilum]|uniref:Predicted O-linked N-acetylglucosamine transferase, SPINDLY family n=1 Tax=Sphingobacterium thalpophilum TaxID=259 RepID=A0A4U9U6A4_9SPHI|nr:tetratricopeptide repeat protein [Sphingobacterium thalpophilum]VTR27657.1 Predicted O-linked N-acetylglucosamine transferase, SPINDLY family [Sphingobacterium thalpophilum]
MKIFAILCLLSLPIYNFAQYSTREIDTLLINEKPAGQNASGMERILWNKKIIDLAHKMNYQKGKVLGYTNVGRILRQNFELKESLKYLHIAEDLSKNVDDNFVKGRLYIEYAQVFNQLGLFETAVKYCDIGIAHYTKLKPADRYRKALRYAYGCRGAYYQELDPIRALASLRKAVELDPTPIALSNIATHYLKFEYNEDSIQLYLKRSFELLDSPVFKNNSYHRSAVLLTKADFLMHSHQYREAIVCFREVFELSKNFVGQDMVLAAYRGIARAYQQLGSTKKGTDFLQRAKILEDSLVMARNRGLAVSVDKLFADNRTFQQSLDRQRVELGLTLAVCLGILVLVAFFLFGYRKKMLIRIQERDQEHGVLLDQVNNENEELFSRKVDHLIELAKENDPKFFIVFQEVYLAFFERLRSIDPKISNETLKFCALLKLNFSTKDISLYTHIEVRSVQTRKSRLRKQLNIPSDVDLNVFMDQLCGD